MEKPDLSIIIVSYNTARITKDCIDSIVKSLKNSEISYEIVVVDNNSTDESIKAIENCKLKIVNLRLIESKINFGFGRGNNLGVKNARGQYILLLNSDTLVLDDAIENLFNFFKQNTNEYKFAGGKLLNKDMTAQPSCGPFYSLPIVFGALFLKGDYWGLTRMSPIKTQQVDWISGACIITKKEYFEKINGFDEQIFMYMEEIDLLYRAKKIDYKTGFYPNAKFIHLGSASSEGKTYPILQVYRGFIYFYKKHHSKSALNLLKFLLKLKALISIIIGRVTKNVYLTQTYEKAYQIAAMDR